MKDEVLTEAEAIARCKDIVVFLERTVRHAILSHATLEAANADKRLLSALDETAEAQAFEVVRFSLMQSLLMQVARCWDSTWEDRASVWHLRDLLQNSGALNALAVDAASSNHSQAEEVRAKLGRLMEALSENASDCQVALRKRVFGYRNHFIAHNLIPKPAARARDEDVQRLLVTTEQVVKTAHVLIVGHDPDFDGYRETNTEYARLFWARFRGSQ